MFGSDNFPLGPNGQFPKKRMNSFGRMLIPGVSAQDTYLNGGSSVSKLPNLERDFNQSNQKVKGRLTREAKIIRGGFKGVNRFRPRYAPYFGGRMPVGMSGEDFEHGMDTDPVYDASGHLMDEGETDDSVGYYRGRNFLGRMSAFAGLLKRGVAGSRRVMPTGTAVIRRR